MRKLQIIGYVGDRDVKCFETMINDRSYQENYDIVKEECMGHILISQDLFSVFIFFFFS